MYPTQKPLTETHIACTHYVFIGYGLDDRASIPGRGNIEMTSVNQLVQTCSGAPRG